MIEDSLPLKPPLDALLGISVPRLYFTAVMHIEKHMEEDRKTNHEESWEEGGTSHLVLPSATSKCLTLIYFRLKKLLLLDRLGLSCSMCTRVDSFRQCCYILIVPYLM